MFTGIIESVGEILDIEPKGSGYFFSIANKTVHNQTALGNSVSVSGVCLSVVSKQTGRLFFEVMPETLRKTTLGKKQVGDKINLETSLRIGDQLGGHFIFGHVDGVGKVTAVKSEGDNLLLTLRLPQNLRKYIAPRCSVAVDGVSLTVARLTTTGFMVSLIENTIKRTTLGQLRAGDEVNIECDMLAKYAERILIANDL